MCWFHCVSCSVRETHVYHTAPIVQTNCQLYTLYILCVVDGLSLIFLFCVRFAGGFFAFSRLVTGVTDNFNTDFGLHMVSYS